MRLNELEDIVVQQDNQIAALSEKIRSLQAEVEKWRQREEATTVSLGKQKEALIEGNKLLSLSISGIVHQLQLIYHIQDQSV